MFINEIKKIFEDFTFSEDKDNPATPMLKFGHKICKQIAYVITKRTKSLNNYIIIIKITT